MSIKDEAGSKIVRILDVPVSVLNLRLAIEIIADWITRHENRYVCIADVHSLMYARKDPAHKRAMDGADMVTPDGTPLVWVSRLRGVMSIARVCGPDLLPAVCAHSVTQGWRHFFFGGAEGVPEELSKRLEAKFPGLRVVGVYSPPFRPLTVEEDMQMIQQICEAKPDIVWVGLGCPKQEKWMAAHVGQIPGAVLVGIGAAFDFHAGRINRAPLWMQKWGFEWLHRLLSEPRRLWQRYLISAPQFVFLAGWETLMLRFQHSAERSNPPSTN